MSLLVLALVLGGAEPLPQRPTFVQYEAVEGCPQRELFERALVYRTDRIRLVRTDADATATISVEISKKRQFIGKLALRTANGRASTKQIVGVNCEPVARALSLAAALLLDPEAKLGKLPEVLPPPPLPVEPPAQPVDAGAPPPEVVEPADAGAVVIELPAVIVDAGVDAGVESPGPQVQFTVFGVGRAQNAIGPRFDFGGGLAAQVDVLLPASPIVATTRVGFGLESGATVTNSIGTVEYLLHAVANLDAGAAWQLGRYFRPEIGASVQLFPLTVRGLGADEVVTSQRWLWALSPYVRLQLNLGAWRVAAQAGLGIHLRVEHYRIEPNGEVFALPAVFADTSLQVGRTIP